MMIRTTSARIRVHGPAALRLLLLGFLALGLDAWVNPSAAQELSLKELHPSRGPDGCMYATPRPTPSPEQRVEAARLVDAAHQAALMGDQETALRYFQQAARLNPADENIAYHLGRSEDDAGNVDAAVREYCRYLALSPRSSDAAEVETRLEQLLPAATPVPTAEAVAQQFAHGVEFYQRGSYREAERAFGYVLQQAPDLAAAHFNRGLARAARHQQRGAAQDLLRYLELAPEAPDNAAVTDYLARLQAERPNPSGVLARGLLVPGLGQVSTGRPALGILILGGAGAAAYVALQPSEVVRVGRDTDPFGNPYEWEYLAMERTDLAAGLALAAGITLLGAVEAYLHAQGSGTSARPVRQASNSRSLVPRLTPADGGLRVEFTLGLTGR